MLGFFSFLTAFSNDWGLLGWNFCNSNSKKANLFNFRFLKSLYFPLFLHYLPAQLTGRIWLKTKKKSQIYLGTQKISWLKLKSLLQVFLILCDLVGLTPCTWWFCTLNVRKITEFVLKNSPSTFFFAYESTYDESNWYCVQNDFKRQLKPNIPT